MPNLKPDKVFENIPHTEILMGRTTIPIVLRQALGITEENEKEFEVKWDVNRNLEIIFNIVKK